MPLITSRNHVIQECGLELTATQCEGYAIALGVPFDGVHDGSGTGERVGGGGDGGTESPPVSTASSSVKAPSGGRAWSATEMHSLVEVE